MTIHPENRQQIDFTTAFWVEFGDGGCHYVEFWGPTIHDSEISELCSHSFLVTMPWMQPILTMLLTTQLFSCPPKVVVDNNRLIGMSEQRLASCGTLVDGTDLLGTNATGPQSKNMDIDALIKATMGM